MQRYAHLLIILPVFLLDRWTKLLVEDHLRYGDASAVFSWLSIVNWRNTGGLFGIMSHRGAGRFLFILIPLLIMGGIAYYVIFFRLPLWSRLALTFVLSGAIGNMYDRISYGYVVDFIDVSYGAYHWPAFNVADSSITFGIGLWLCTELFLKEGRGKRSPS